MISTLISNYIHVKQWDVITDPRPNFTKRSLAAAKPPLK